VKTLYLLRHAKSSWDDPDLRDHDRPLNDRGRGAAPKMGKHMAEQGWLPQLVMSSTSQRTRETWDLLSPELDGAPDEVEFSEELYHAHAGTLLTLIEGLDDGWDSAMLIGHNPGMHAAADMLAGDGDPNLRDELGRKFPTGALAVYEFDVDSWSGAHAKVGNLIDFVKPRKL